MKINDEGTSNAAHWHERAMKAEARLQKIMARCADLLDEDQFNELDAMARAAIPTPASQPSAAPAWFTEEHIKNGVPTNLVPCGDAIWLGCVYGDDDDWRLYAVPIRNADPTSGVKS